MYPGSSTLTLIFSVVTSFCYFFVTSFSVVTTKVYSTAFILILLSIDPPIGGLLSVHFVFKAYKLKIESLFPMSFSYAETIYLS